MAKYSWTPGGAVQAGGTEPQERPRLLDYGRLGVDRFADGRELGAACAALGAGPLFVAIVGGTIDMDLERTQGVGDWMRESRCIEPDASWWQRAKNRHFVLISGTHADFCTLDDQPGHAVVRVWDHDFGYASLPEPVSVRAWLQDRIAQEVECTLVLELEDEPSKLASAVSALRDAMAEACGEEERAWFSKWWGSQWFSAPGAFDES